MEYKNRLAAKVAEEAIFEQKQEALRKKYNIDKDGVIRVVKKRWSEIIVKDLVSLLKTILAVLHIMLSTVGAICLLYPDTRAVLYRLCLDWYAQALKLLFPG